MNNIFLNLRKATKHLSYPFIFSAIFVFAGAIILSTPLAEITAIEGIWKDFSLLITDSMIVGFIVHYECKGSKRATVAITSFLICDIAFFSFCSYHFGILLTVVLAFILAKILKSTNIIYGYIILLIAGLIAGISLGAITPLIKNALQALATFFSGKGASFGIVENIYSIFLGNSLADIFYHNDYSGAMLIDDKLVTGVKDILFAGGNEKGNLISEYLSGKYFANIFIPIGTYICIYNRLEKDELNAITLTLALSVITGNNYLFYAYVFLFNPFIYMGNIFTIFAGYVIAQLIDIKNGFLLEGSIIELIKYGNKWIYFILCGIVLCALSYFVTRLLNIKFDIRGNRILPREVKAIVLALGGEDNIERIANKKLYVKNPNLINILKIDCDIHENEVTMIYDELELLKEYF